MMLLVLAGQIGPHIHDHRPRNPFDPIDSAAWTWADLPSNWFAAPVELLLRGPSRRAVALSALAIFATIGLFAALLGTLSLDYLERLAAAGEASPSAIGVNRGVALWRRAVALLCARPRTRHVRFLPSNFSARPQSPLARLSESGLRLCPRAADALSVQAHLTFLALAARSDSRPSSDSPAHAVALSGRIARRMGLRDDRIRIHSGSRRWNKKSDLFTFQLPALILFSVPLFFFAGPLPAGAAMVFASASAFISNSRFC